VADPSFVEPEAYTNLGGPLYGKAYKTRYGSEYLFRALPGPWKGPVLLSLYNATYHIIFSI